MTPRPTAANAPPCGHDRRTFLKGVGLATAAGTAATAGLAPPAAEAAGTAPVFTEPRPKPPRCPRSPWADTRSPA